MDRALLLHGGDARNNGLGRCHQGERPSGAFALDQCRQCFANERELFFGAGEGLSLGDEVIFEG